MKYIRKRNFIFCAIAFVLVLSFGVLIKNIGTVSAKAETNNSEQLILNDGINSDDEERYSVFIYEEGGIEYEFVPLPGYEVPDENNTIKAESNIALRILALPGYDESTLTVRAMYNDDMKIIEVNHNYCYIENINTSLYVIISVDVIEYTVNYVIDGVTLTSNYKSNIDVVLDQPSREGYSFIGWYRNEDYSGEKITIIEKGNVENLTLYGFFEPIQYEIRYNYFNTEFQNPNPKTFTIEDVRNNTFSFLIIIDKTARRTKKCIWSLTDIGEAVNTNFLQDGYLEVSGYWVEIKAKIVFELNGGTYDNNTDILYYYESFELGKPERIGYIFDGWYINDFEVTEVVNDILSNNETDTITVVARWKTRIDADVYTLDRNLQILDLSGYRRIILILPYYNFYYPCKIIIPKELEQIHIFSQSENTNYDLYIEIENRSTNLDLYLENVRFCGPAMLENNKLTTYDTISMETSNNSALNLYTFGNVYIYGPTVNRISGYTYDGSYAIKCEKLNIMSADYLYLIGGKGSSSSRNKPAVSTTNINYFCNKSNVSIT